MSVTAAAGFRAAGTTAGLKPSGKPDVAVVVNDGPKHEAAAVFTTNRVAAAPVLWSRQAVSDGRADAVVLNSGGANAATGHQGFQDAHRTAEHAADALGCSAGDVLVCSTGLIGELLDMDRLLPGVQAAVAGLDADGGAAAAEEVAAIVADELGWDEDRRTAEVRRYRDLMVARIRGEGTESDAAAAQALASADTDPTD